jgi:hypothetical protein
MVPGDGKPKTVLAWAYGANVDRKKQAITAKLKNFLNIANRLLRKVKASQHEEIVTF